MKGGVASFEINLVYSVVTDNDGTLNNKPFINRDIDVSQFFTDDQTLENKLYSFIPPVYKSKTEIINIILTSKYDYESVPGIPIRFMDELYKSPKVIYNTISSLKDKYQIFIVEIFLRNVKSMKSKGSKKKRKKSFKNKKKKSNKRKKKSNKRKKKSNKGK
tara:strand:+ start:79 stop:561 length:483 start_codon:yes stop_codon:yes gene_type:complete